MTFPTYEGPAALLGGLAALASNQLWAPVLTDCGQSQKISSALKETNRESDNNITFVNVVA